MKNLGQKYVCLRKMAMVSVTRNICLIIIFKYLLRILRKFSHWNSTIFIPISFYSTISLHCLWEALPITKLIILDTHSCMVSFAPWLSIWSCPHWLQEGASHLFFSVAAYLVLPLLRQPVKWCQEEDQNGCSPDFCLSFLQTTQASHFYTSYCIQ